MRGFTMDNKLVLMNSLASEFALPIVGDNSRIWFFRTQSGLYYFDFYFDYYFKYPISFYSFSNDFDG